MHRGWEISGYHDVQDIGSSRGVVWVSGWGVRPEDKTGVPIGIVTQGFSPPRAQPRVPVDMEVGSGANNWLYPLWLLFYVRALFQKISIGREK